MSEQQIASAPLGDEEEIFGTVDAVEIEKQPMIDFGLVEDEKAAEYIDHKIEEIVDATVALEGYITILRKASWDGVSKQTARAIMVGVNRIDKQFGERSALSVSMEDETSDTSMIGTDREKSKLDESGLVGKAKELWAKFIEFMKESITKARAKISKVLEYVVGIKPKLVNLYEAFDDWSPNGPTGGKKITVPGKTAAYTLVDGKPIDPAAIMALRKYINDAINPTVVRINDQISKLNGNENIIQVLEKIAFTLPPLPDNIPGNLNVSLDNDEFSFEFTGTEEPVELQVRSRNEIRKYLKGMISVVDYVSAARDGSDKTFEASMAMIDKAFTLAKDDTAVVKELRETITRVNKLRTTALDLTIHLSTMVVRSFELCDLEYGKPAEPDADPDYGMESISDKLKDGLKKMVEVFKAAIERIKAMWDKLTKSPEAMRDKVAELKLTVREKKNQGDSNDADEKEPQTPVKISISGPMATAVTENDKLISPTRYLPLTNYVMVTVAQTLAPLVDKLINGYAANDIEAIRSVAQFDLPVFDDVITNGWKVEYDAGGSFFPEGEELNVAQLTVPTFEETMSILNDMEKVAAHMSSLQGPKSPRTIADKMAKFTLQLTNDFMKSDKDEVIGAALESRVKLVAALESMTKTVFWLNSRTMHFFKFVSSH